MAATATRDEKSLSPAEKKIMKMGFAQGAKEIRKKVSAALGHMADPAWMTGGDLVAGAAGMAVDLGGGMLTAKLAQPANPGDAPNFVARNKEYVSGALSMGLGATAYAANLAMSGSKVTPVRVGVRTAATTTFWMGASRVFRKKFSTSLPQF